MPCIRSTKSGILLLAMFLLPNGKAAGQNPNCKQEYDHCITEATQHVSSCNNPCDTTYPPATMPVENQTCRNQCSVTYGSETAACKSTYANASITIRPPAKTYIVQAIAEVETM